MIETHLKKLGKDSMTLTATGVGLSVASGLGGGAAVSSITSKMGTIGGIVATGTALNIVQDMMPKKKKKY